MALAETAADDEQMQALKAFPVAERLPLAAKMDEVRLRFAQGNLKGARDLAEAHLEAHPELHALRNLLALIYFEDNDLEAAIRCAEMVYLLAPEKHPGVGQSCSFPPYVRRPRRRHSIRPHVEWLDARSSRPLR